jgi:hypothetical protein
MRGGAPPIAAIVFALAACKRAPAKGESIDEVCRTERSGQTVSVSGYLQMPFLVGCDDKAKDCWMQLTSTKEKNYEMRISVPLGSGPSTMTPLPRPKDASQPPGIVTQEITVDLRDASGKKLSRHDFVRVTGDLTARPSNGKADCNVAVTKLERL